MKKVLVVLVLVGLFTGVPELRQKAAPRVAPIWDRLLEFGSDLIHPFLMPIQRNHARSDAEAIILRIRERYIQGQPFPNARTFHQWVKQTRLTDTGGLDPWGSAYQFLLRRDSVLVYSLGPDLEYDTEDDIRIGFEVGEGRRRIPARR